MPEFTATPIERDVLIVRGTDAGEYLQTQLTQDVLSLAVDESAWSFLLKPKSEILALLRVTRIGEEGYVLDMESGWGDTVRRTIDEFLFRMDIEFEQAVWPCIAWRGDIPDSMKTPVEGVILFERPEGIDELGPDVRVPVDADVANDAELEQARVASGWPAMGSEIDGSVTPAMTGLVAETVAFEKGCYTGQEFVARVHYRGAGPPKRLVQLAFDENSELLPGATITVEENQAGYVTSAARGVALGYLKRGFEAPLVGHVDDVEVRLLADPSNGIIQQPPSEQR